MNDIYFTFRSVTGAMRGREILRENGIAAGLLRTPRGLRENGCGYALRVAAAAERVARELLARADIPFRNSYRRDANGAWREVAT